MRGRGVYRVNSQVPYVLPRRRAREATRPWTIPTPTLARANSFEGGTDGVVITTGNSGGLSGDAFSEVVGSPTYEIEARFHGDLGASATSASETGLRWSGLATRRVYLRAYVREESGLSPTAALTIASVRSVDQQIIASVSMLTDNKLRLEMGGVTATTSIAVTLGGGLYRLEMFVDAGNRQATMRVHWNVSGTQSDPPSQWEELSVQATQASYDANKATIHDAAFFLNHNNGGTREMDSLALSTVDWLGRVPVSTPTQVPAARRSSHMAWRVR